MSTTAPTIEVTKTGGIFLSYRRDDSAGHTGRLTDDLRDALPTLMIFRDIDTIAPGADFVKAIHGAVGQADVVLAVIGRRWLTAADLDQGRRLANVDDYVRLEITSAFEQGKLVIPVLVDGAQVPSAADLPDPLKALVRNNAIEISDLRWKYDVGRLVAELRRDTGMPATESESGPAARPATGAASRRRLLVGAGVLLLLVGAVLLLVAGPGSSTGGTDHATETTVTAPSTSVTAPTPSTTPESTSGGQGSGGSTSGGTSRGQSRPAPTPVNPSPPAAAPTPTPTPTPSPSSTVVAPAPTTDTTPRQTTYSWPYSPDGRFEASPTGDHYQVVDVASGVVVITTHPEFDDEPTNPVQAVAFSADSTTFAAAYHYGHDGEHTWIGYWSTSSGGLMWGEEVPGLLYSIDDRV